MNDIGGGKNMEDNKKKDQNQEANEVEEITSKVQETKDTEEKVSEVQENVEVKDEADESGEALEFAEKSSNKKKIIIGAAAVVVAIAVGVGVYANSKLNKVKQTPVKEEELKVDKETEEDVEEEFLNVAIFGVNVKSESDKTSDSDAVYVASLNQKTKEVKLLPVYGNTLMKSGSDTIKMKEAYAKGGAQEAIAVLNENLNMNIKDYVSLNFQSMVDAIDILGGIEIDVKKDEIPHINGYAEGIAKALGKEVKVVEKEGAQLLDGAQATGYCRIRVTDGGDVQRGNRQVEVINKMLAKLKEANFSQMDKIMDAVFPQVETNFDKAEMINYGKDAAAYKLTTIPAFPREIKEQVRKPKEEGVQFNDFEEVVEGTNVEKDVEDIHNELFPEK